MHSHLIWFLWFLYNQCICGPLHSPKTCSHLTRACGFLLISSSCPAVFPHRTDREPCLHSFAQLQWAPCCLLTLLQVPQTSWGDRNGSRYWCSEAELHPKSLSRQSCFHLKSDDATWAELPANASASAKSPASGMNSRLVHLFLAQPQASLRAFPTALSTSEMRRPFSAPPLLTSSLKWVRDVPDEMM